MQVSTWRRSRQRDDPKAFSSEVVTGSREENASNRKTRADQALEWVNRKCAEQHGRDERKRAIERRGMKSCSGSPGQGTRVQMQTGFRR